MHKAGFWHVGSFLRKEEQNERQSVQLNVAKVQCAVLTTLRDAGFETYFAGGCVRDRMLSSAPTEYDIATAARPDDIVKVIPKS